MFKNETILVIGAGSIGERHIRTLWKLGYQNIIVYRQRNLPFRDIADAKVTVITNWNEVLQQKPFAAIICTPSAQHTPQAIQCLQNNIHVLVEKPLGGYDFNSTALLNAVNQSGKYLQVAYMLHYHPLLQKVKSFTETKELGKLLNIQTCWAEYLPNWHPWEDYRESYAAKKELGGGVALTLSHDIDVCNWIVGSNIKKFASFPSSTSHLEVNTESIFDANLLYENGVTAHVHLNYVQAVNERWYKFIFDKALVTIDYYKASIKISTFQDETEEVIEDFNRDDLFINQTKDFFLNIQKEDRVNLALKNILQSETVIKICTNEQ